MNLTLRDHLINCHEIEKKLLENDGLITEEIESMISLRDNHLPEKVDGYANMMDFLNSRIEFIDNKIKQAQVLKKNYEKSVVRMKEMLKFVITDLNIKSLDGLEYGFKLNQSPPKLIIENENSLPEKYKTQIISYEIDKEKLKSDLKLSEIAGAKLEQGTYVKQFLVK